MDNALVMVMIAFMTFALTMGGSVVDNIIKNTSQPEKMKSIKPQHRSLQEIKWVFFGKNPRFYDYFLPTTPDYSWKLIKSKFLNERIILKS